MLLTDCVRTPCLNISKFVRVEYRSKQHFQKCTYEQRTVPELLLHLAILSNVEDEHIHNETLIRGISCLEMLQPKFVRVEH